MTSQPLFFVFLLLIISGAAACSDEADQGITCEASCPDGGVADTASNDTASVDSSDAAPDLDSTDLSDTSQPLTDLLDLQITEPGPFGYGYRTWDATYQPAGRPERATDMHVWYPTEAVHDDTTEWPTYLRLVDDRDAIIDAAPAAPVPPAGYPVMLYSHGSLGFPQDIYKLAGYMASHGWMTVAVGHPPNRMSDGQSNMPLTHWHDRAQDLTTALDLVEALAEDGPLHGLASLENVLVFGHSRGAYGSWAVAGATYDVAGIREQCANDDFRGDCSETDIVRFGEGFGDDRIAGILPTAGDGHPNFFAGVGGMNDVEVPILMISAELDTSLSGLFESLDENLDLTWVELAEGCHTLFTLGCDPTQDELGFPNVAALSLAFGRRVVLGDQSEETVGMLDGSIALSDRVTVVTE